MLRAPALLEQNAMLLYLHTSMARMVLAVADAAS
jgi:hypothetical protein